MDSKTGLPPFALAVRGKDKDEDTKKKDPEESLMDQMFRGLVDILPTDTSLSSSFFLLKQHPDILAEYLMENGEDIGCKDTNIQHAISDSITYQQQHANQNGKNQRKRAKVLNSKEIDEQQGGVRRRRLLDKHE